MIIGLAGKKQSGKSTVASRLADHGFWQASFSSTLKLMIRVMLKDMGLTEAELVQAEKNKEAVIPRLGRSYRYLCQTLGTEWGRSMVHADLWLMCAEHRHLPPESVNVVIDDVRFESEADFIRQRGGMVIHLVRKTGVVDDHVSESGVTLALDQGDVLIGNNGSIEGLFSRVCIEIDKRFDTVVLV